MYKKILLNFIVISFSLIFVLTFSMMFVTYSDILREIRTELVAQTKYFSVGYYELGVDYLVNVGDITNRRITLISNSGVVLYDNYADISMIENHANREEFINALKFGSGESRRRSDTVNNDLTYYYAIKLNTGEVLRLAITTNSLTGIFDKTSNYLLIILIANIFFSMYMSKQVTKNIIKPINQINLEQPLENDVYNELSPLLVKMHRQKHMIDAQIEEIKMKNDEFNFITETMNDALIVFSSDKHILSANKFSQVLFANPDPVGKTYLEFSRNADYLNILEQAFLGKSAECKYKYDGKFYSLIATPVLTKGDFAVVLLGCDITQREQNEQMRRDFSANVSHELKTPLTSIIGFSDIMLNGIAKVEDFTHFIEKINNEARRLLTLIEDIIRLSNLDEDSIKREFSPINIQESINNVVSKLEFKANERGIKFHILAEEIYLNGVEHSIYELIFNLCDNAISYNKENGEVYVNCFVDAENIILSIKDTGIGISATEKEYVFERFYRVDKSHSKDTGGTGLGLSIVKHIALLHNAKIEIISQVDIGTEIKVIFNVTE